jgi:hypothetical protein
MSCADAEDSRVSGLAFRCTHSAMAPRVDGNSNAAMKAVSPHPQGTAINGTRISTPTSLVASSDCHLRVGTHARGPARAGLRVLILRQMYSGCFWGEVLPSHTGLGAG